MNERIYGFPMDKGSKKGKKIEKTDKKDKYLTDELPTNKGEVIYDAAVCPQDIAYPTVLGLLNTAREITEAIIDHLHAKQPDGKKPRTYRQMARFGDYSVIVTDQNGWESMATATVPCTLRIDVRNEGNNTFTVEALDGVPPFNLSWSTNNFANTQTLPPGTHTVKVSDGFGCCEILHTITIEDQPEDGTFTDLRDGNVYKTVKIGTQTWFAENLRYAGDIPHVPSKEAWAAIWNYGNPTGQPAWVYYNNDSNKNAVYGKLYNWYTVNTGTLCPSGWHIPTGEDALTLFNFLGDPDVAGGKLKIVTGWDSPNTGATNETGFSGLPGGYRWVSGTFIMLGSNGHWWSSSGTNDFGSYWQLIGSSENITNPFTGPSAVGSSCRCLKD